MSKESTTKASSSKPKILDRVLETIGKLGERNGSSTKDIIKYMLKSDKTNIRNLTVQVQQALRLALSSDQVRLRSGRYKLCIAKPKIQRTVKPKTPANVPAASAVQPKPTDDKQNKITKGKKRRKRDSKTAKSKCKEKDCNITKATVHTESSDKTSKKK